MSKKINQILNVDEIILVHPYSKKEIFNPKFGGARLILEQIKFLKYIGHNVRIISLKDIGSLVSSLYRIRENSKKKGYKLIYTSEKRRWLLNLIYVLLIELISIIDILFYLKVKKLLKVNPKNSLLIYNYPYGLGSLFYTIKKLSLKIIICEHNIEWKFFESKIGNNPASKFLVFLAKKIELNNLKKADYVFCLNEKDRKVLIKEGIKEKKIMVWIPYVKDKINTNKGKVSPRLKKKLKGKFVIGFLGSNFEPNIKAVENIISLSRKVPKDVIFLIVGSINKAFEDRTDVSQNIIFTGYVKNPDSYLALCDAFINPKTTSDTGIEIKMFDYLKFNKPIIATKFGAMGFENFKNIIISDEKNIPSTIKSITYKKARLKW